MAKGEILKPFILSWEGGFVCDPYDRGGATNKGVTIGTFRSVYGRGMSVSDLKRMTDAQWMHIFKVYYWDRWRADDIRDQSVANILVDWMWLSGTTSVKKVQRLLKVSVDGVVGPKTIAAVNGSDAKTLFNRIKAVRTEYINAIATGRQARYRKGWMRRLNGIGYRKLLCNDGTVHTF
jgi:lysozyme family protein